MRGGAGREDACVRVVVDDGDKDGEGRGGGEAVDVLQEVEEVGGAVFGEDGDSKVDRGGRGKRGRGKGGGEVVVGEKEKKKEVGEGWGNKGDEEDGGAEAEGMAHVKDGKACRRVEWRQRGGGGAGGNRVVGDG